MDNDVIISWSFTNWVTIVLMVVLGFAVLALVSQGVRKVKGSGFSLSPGGMNNAPGVA